MTEQDLIDAVSAGDLSRVHNQLVQNNYCGLVKSRVNLLGKQTVAAATTPTATAVPTPNTSTGATTRAAAQICNWGGSWKGSGGYPSTLTMKLVQTVKTDSAGHVVINVAPAPSDVNNPDAPSGTVKGNALNGTWTISSRGGTVEYVMDAGCNQFPGQRFDCYKGTPVPDHPAPACSSGSFTPLKISYQRTSRQPTVPAGAVTVAPADLRSWPVADRVRPTPREKDVRSPSSSVLTPQSSVLSPQPFAHSPQSSAFSPSPSPTAAGKLREAR